VFVQQSSSTRRLMNQDAIVAELRARGAVVTVADFSTMSVSQQVEVTTSACALVGPHDPGLTNLLFLANELEYLVLPNVRQPVSLELVAPMLTRQVEDAGGLEGSEGAFDYAKLAGVGSLGPVCNMDVPATLRADVSALVGSAAAAAVLPLPGDDEDADEGGVDNGADPQSSAGAAAPSSLPPSCLRGGQANELLIAIRAPLNGTSAADPQDVADVEIFVTESAGAAIITLSPPVIELFPPASSEELQSSDNEILAVYNNLACAASKPYYSYIGTGLADSAVPFADREFSPDPQIVVDTIVLAIATSVEVSTAPQCM